MKVLVSLTIVSGLFLLGYFSPALGLGLVFGVLLPYAALGIFVGGMIWRVMSWANVPVPFRIPTTCGQQKSLSWIKNEPLENPHNGLAVIGRMALEVLLFRSLLRNTKTQMTEDRRLVYATDIWLWLGAMAMHVSLAVILIRHTRLFLNPTPWCVTMLGKVDGFLEVEVPVLFVTSLLFTAGLTYLLLRRLVNPQVRYISLVNDYFPLLLLLGIALSGICLRHFEKTDVVAVKELTVGLAGLQAWSLDFSTIAPLFYGHLFLVCVLLAYIPFSKLTHMAGVFLSPTRNLANSNRRVRHVNPWDYPVKTHTYDEYEDELRDKMKAAGLPVEKE